jgi:hypothetical protein
LKRAGLLKPGECTYDTLCWRNQDLKALEVRIFVDLSDANEASLRIAGDVNSQWVAVDCLACPYGGYRCYLLCPLSGARCEQLFFVDGIFASRKAHNLTYVSQSLDELTRARRKARKLKKRLDGDCFPRLRGKNKVEMQQKFECENRRIRSLYRNRLSPYVE